MAFLETPRFPDNIAYGAEGGLAFSTDVVELSNGNEQRNINWVYPRGSWDVSHGVKRKLDMESIIAFHRACQGRAHGFRFKDWTDFQASASNGVLTRVDGTADVYQLFKKYAAGALVTSRIITKPVANKVNVYRNGGLIAATVDTTTGKVTVPAISTKSIIGITKAANGVAEITGHGFSNNDAIKITSVAGMTQVNNQVFTVSVVDANHVQLNVNTSAYSTYTSGGSAIKYANLADTFTWVGEFDVPCRFSDDRLPVAYVANNIIECNQIPVVEIRI